MKTIVIAALCVLSGTAIAQGVRYDNRVAAVASNVPAFSQAPLMAIPGVPVTICVDGQCATKAAIYSNQTLTVQTGNPVKTDGQGRFGFWIAPGSYFYQVKDFSGNVTGIYPFTVGGSSGGGATLPSTPAIVKSLTALTSTPAVASDVVGLFNAGTCIGFLNSDGTCSTPGSPVGQKFRILGFTGPGSGPNTQIGQTNAFTDATGNPLTVPGALTANQANGVANTDRLGGLSSFLSSSLCTNTSCSAAIPPTSTDTTSGTPTPAPTASQGSLFVDSRGNSTGLYGVNPGVTNNASNGPGGAVGPGAQILSHDGVNFTLPNPSLGPSNPNSSQGDPQVYHTEFHNWFDAGFSNGNSGCPLFCAQPQFQAGASDWALALGTYKVLNFFGSGINAGGTDVMQKFSIGDFQWLYRYMKSAGGFVAPSDEGFYPGGAWQAFSLGNYICTINSRVDNYHIFCPTIGAGSQATGGGRYIMNTAHPVASEIQIGAFNPPTGITSYGTITFPNTTIPTGVAAGIVTNGCNVPVQDAGVAIGTDNSTGTSGCIITVTSGAFEASSVHGNPADTAFLEGNLHNVSMEVTAATALASGHQTLTMTLHRSLPAGAFIFQGGVAGALVCLNADNTNLGDQNGQTIFGSCYPLIGSVDSHTAAYVAYNASQISDALPLPASQAISMATDGVGFGGFNLINLSRDSAGNVTGTFNSGNTFNRQVIMNGARFFTITNSAGCTNGLFDSPAASNSVASFISGSDPTLQTLVMPTPVTGAPGTCASAKVFGQGVLADIYWAAEVTDVVNHTNPSAGTDGTIAATYMPPAHFPTGDEIQSPPNYALGITGEFKVMNMATPALKSDGIEVLMNNYSAFGSNAITLVNNPIVQLQFGYQGVASPSTAFNLVGQWGDTFNQSIAPPFNSAVFRIGFTSPNCGGTNNCNLFQNYDFLNIQAGGYREHWDSPTNTMSFQSGGLLAMAISPTAITDSITHILSNAQFDGINDSGVLVPTTQLHPSAPFNRYSPPAAVTTSYDEVIPPPVFVSSTIPAGIASNVYIFVVHLPGGDSFSQPLQIFGQNANPPTGGTNTISCSVVPIGASADLYLFFNPGFQQVIGQTCTGPTGNVTDNGSSYGANTATVNAYSAGATFNTGSFTAQGLRGFIGWTQPDIFGKTTPATTVTASIHQSAAGVLELDAGLPGSALGTFNVGALNVNGSPACTVATGCGGARVASGFCTGTFTSSATISIPGFGVPLSTSACTGTRSAVAGFMLNGTGTLSHLKMRCQTTGINASSGVLTLNVTHAGTGSTFTPTGLTLTYGNATSTPANTVVSDTTHTFNYSDGDILTTAITTQATETLASCNVSVDY